MNKRRTIISTPALDEFIYGVVYESKPAQRIGLKKRVYAACKNPVRLMKMLSVSTIEEKLEILSHFGIDYRLTLFDTKKTTFPKIKELIEPLDERSGVSKTLDKIAEQKVFVLSDKNFNYFLGLCAMKVNHPSFYLNMEMARVGYHFEKWPKRVTIDEGDNLRKVSEWTFFISRLIMTASRHFEFLQSSFAIDECEAKILLLFYNNSNGYISVDDIKERFSGDYSSKKIAGSITALFKMQYIEKHVIEEKKEYAISTSGISVINTIFKNIFKEMTF